ncbi:MAG TPA: DNA polymerase III subunit alpha, partial [Gammaproteobacteria bacterium]|nr:DNA polymerase III subunit alpha [Gammaproteobacteria bacterium]
PIMGAEVLVQETPQEGAERVLLLARDLEGYRNLLALISASYTTTAQRGVLQEQEIFAAKSGLIVLSGGVRGHLWSLLNNGDLAQAKERAQRWQGEFGDAYYLEVTRCGRADEEQNLRHLLTIAASTGIGVVATNDVCFAEADDFEAHETRVCIHEGRTLNDGRRERRYSERQYLRSPQEMAELFHDIPSALANAVEIAKRCNVEVALGTYYLPDYPIPDQQTPEQYLLQVSSEGLSKRLAAGGPADQWTAADYQERLQFELDVINQMGFAGYFLIVMEFIAWAKQNNIPVGPGRGSGGGSLVAYALGITDLDPLQYDLLFERFLNPERVSMPDFDVDFCMEGRDRVIQHVSDMYGVEAVSQIITFGTMAAKAVVRDVARVQGKPYSLADKLSKLIPFEVGMTLAKAMEESQEMADFVAANEEVSEIMDMAYKLEGIVRNVGRHAGGVVIAPSALTDFVPLYTEDSGSGLVSQYDKDDVERAGLVKFDFLGLKTLTIVDWTLELVNQHRQLQGESALEVEDIPIDDPAAFKLLRAAETTGVFQLESRGMKDLIRRLLPDGINDVIALVALFRPGPLQSGAVDDYIDRKHGKAAVAYPHPSLQPVLESTYGVVLYQEQVMQIAQVLAGFSLGQADLLRRAMGKKKAEEMAKVREQFLHGTGEHDIAPKLANEIFDLMEKFAGYAFNKSHSATYALVSVHTAWLKARYPAQFMAANLSADMQNIDRVVVLIEEVRRMQLPLRPPSVNDSDHRFTVKEDAVVYGLGAVRGVGEGPVAAIMEARKERPFQDLDDFCHRVDSKKANKRVLEALVCAGAMDDFALAGEDLNQTRARLLEQVPRSVQGAEQTARDQAAGIVDLFGGMQQGGSQNCAPVENAATMASLERLNGERETLGLFLTGHPIQEYEQELRQFCRRRLNDLKAAKDSQWIAGMVVNVRMTKSRRGVPMCFVQLDDRSARIEVSLMGETFDNYAAKVNKDKLLVIEGEVQFNEFSGGLAVRGSRVLNIDEARQRFSKGLEIDFSDVETPADLPTRLKTLLGPYRQNGEACPVHVLYQGHSAVGRISLGADWRGLVSDELLQSLRSAFGDSYVRVQYAGGADGSS